MIILKRKHEDAILKTKKESYNLGYVEGRKNSIEELESTFNNKVTEYENKNMKVTEENVQLALQVRNMDDMICSSLKDRAAKKKDIKNLEDKVEYLEQSRSEAYELIHEMINKSEKADILAAEREKKIDILKFFLRCNYDKDVARYEAIAKRTKNSRIKEKAEKKIIEIKQKKLAFN